MNNKFIIFVVVAILVVGGSFYVFKYAKAPTNNYAQQESGQQPQAAEPQNTTPVQPMAKITVAMTSSGFSPKILTIKRGIEVTFINKDTVAHWPASGPHPAHTCYPGFDSLKPVAPGSSYSHVFDLVKTCGFHDHLNFSTYGHGSITIE